MEDPADFIAELRKTRELQLEATIKVISGSFELKKDYAYCMQVARNLYDNDYDHSIRDIVTTFPEDHEEKG